MTVNDVLLMSMTVNDAGSVWDMLICQGRSKTSPLGWSKSRPIDQCEVVEYAG
jgi:hypothetical protein